MRWPRGLRARKLKMSHPSSKPSPRSAAPKERATFSPFESVARPPRNLGCYRHTRSSKLFGLNSDDGSIRNAALFCAPLEGFERGWLKPELQAFPTECALTNQMIEKGG